MGLARENDGWGYLRIVGELGKLGIDVPASFVRNVLKDAVSRRRRRTLAGSTGACSCASTG